MINAFQALDKLTAIAVDIQKDIDTQMANLGTDNVVSRSDNGITCKIKTTKVIPAYMTQKLTDYFVTNGFNEVQIMESVDESGTSTEIRFTVPIVRQTPQPIYAPQYPQHPQPMPQQHRPVQFGDYPQPVNPS